MNDVGKQEHKEKKAAVILAAGSGRRMNTPVAKQFLDLMGIPVFLHSVRLFDKIADKIVLVTSPDAVEYCQNLLEKEELCAEVIVIAGKSERFLSSMEGVRAASDCDLIMIHDAARACVDMEVIERSIASARIHGSGVAAVPLKDTVRGFKAIVDGEMDEYPEAAFFNVGTIEDVIERAKTMGNTGSAS